MKVEDRILENGDLEIKLVFDSHDQLCLNHDLLDIVHWYKSGPSAEKIYSCRKRMILQNKEKLFACKEMSMKTLAEVKDLMSDPVALCEEISKMPEYKNRKQREASGSN